MSIELAVSGMSCGHCVKSITQAIVQLDAKAEVKVDLASARVKVTSSLSQDQVMSAIDDLGFEATAL